MPQTPPDELANRRARFAEIAAPLRLNGFALFHSHNVGYLSGFSFVPTERPIAYVEAADGECALVVPELEAEHAAKLGGVKRVVSYDEFPGDMHPMELVRQVIHDLGLDGPGRRLGVDHDGYPPVWGYWGPALTELIGSELVPLSRSLDRTMMIKSEHEIELLRMSSDWAVRAHELLQAYTAVGLTETEVSQRASSDATVELAEVVPGYSGGGLGSGARAGYRGQIGRHGALPHSIGESIRFEAGDTLVTGATAPMWGYVSELERTMFLGPPSDEQRRLFDHMVRLQDIGFDAIRAGEPASAVDDAVRAYFESENLWGHWRHHVGHGIGRRYHEAPFLDRGDHTILEPGMVLTVEPGLYDPDWGGFRHSDTVVVTDDGLDMITAAYPSDLESLVIPLG